jgi:DNA polymerase
MHGENAKCGNSLPTVNKIRPRWKRRRSFQSRGWHRLTAGGELTDDRAVIPVVRAVAEPKSAAPWVPEHPTLSSLRRAAARCRGCPLWKTGTQTVFGEGAAAARVLLVGEQPGDQEDRVGRPFVGPAGRLLDEALAAAGIDRSEAYVTNAVKHFKWEPAGKRRLHKKPNAREIAACRPWLEAELATLHPELVIALGATAAQTLLGPAFRVTRQRGERLEVPWAGACIATIHPSALLRMHAEDRARELQAFIADLRVAAQLLRR